MSALLVMARDAEDAFKERCSRRAVEEAGIYGIQSEEALAAVSELISAADSALAALGAYAEKIDGEWGDCLKLEQLLANGEEPEYVALRDALARVKGGAA